MTPNAVFPVLVLPVVALAIARSDLVRAMTVWPRWADAALVQQATRNAAVTLAEQESHRLEEARTLRDLSRLSGSPASAHRDG